jgi:alpha-tubulin suppressor-like RCC1 family protein
MVVTKSLARVALSAAALALGFTLTPASAQPGPGSAQPGEGSVDHWGGYIGTPGQDVHLVPAPISLPGQVAEVGTSNSTEYALLTNGTLYAWGGGTRGQLGNGRKSSSNSVPVRVQFPPGVQIASIPTDVMPFDTGLAVDTHGHVWGWGANKDGELCLGTTHPYTTPVELPFSGVSAVAGAGAHATYDAGGTLYSCGSGRYGELGDGSMQNSTTPARVQGLNGQLVTGLVAAFANEGALLGNGQYVNWGLDSEGQLGNGTVNRSSDVPVLVSLPGRVTQVAEGGSLFNNGQTLVMLSDGSLRAWGDGREYQLGNGRKGVSPSPVPFSAPPGVTYTTVATSGNTSYALSTDGVVYAWGASNAGQVGDGKKAAARQPVAVDSGAASLSATANDVAVSVQHHRR